MIDLSIARAQGGFLLDVSFQVQAGITALFGRSGAGKSTILDCIAGLTRPDRGRIVMDGETLFDSGARTNVAAHRRRIGYVFQDSLLFPHLSVAQNLDYGKVRGAAAPSRSAVIETLGISRLLDRRPARLSGGERQRVAIGRALLSAPRLLLMDEPMSSLDTARKMEILSLIERIRDSFAIPVIYVSHDVAEVARLADHVVLIENGGIAGSGTPGAVFAAHPAAADSQRGRLSILTARAVSHDETYGLTILDHAAGPIAIAARLPLGRDMPVVIHATDVALAAERPQNVSLQTALRGTIAALDVTEAPTAMVTVTLAGGQTLLASATRKAVDRLSLAPGQAIWCLIKSVSIDAALLPAA
jgi:molybdate transport system ATP-binding protein